MMQKQVGGEPSFFGILLGGLITLSFHLEILVCQLLGIPHDFATNYEQRKERRL
jgi:hypothetical protein